jgi:hypothetical protein
MPIIHVSVIARYTEPFGKHPQLGKYAEQFGLSHSSAASAILIQTPIRFW